MTTRSKVPARDSHQGRLNDKMRAGLLDENEQLQTSLETALEVNAKLIDDRDRLLRRVADLAHELHLVRHKAPADTVKDAAREAAAAAAAAAQQGQTDEELRVAFEELQVLAEELEVANASLHEANAELDERVKQRTRQIREVNLTLRAAEASFHTVADLVPDLLWRTDNAGEATWLNQRWINFTGQRLDEAMGLGWLDAIHVEDRAVSRASWALAVASGQPYQHQHRICDANGIPHWFLVRAEPLRDEDGRIVHWFAAGTDINEQRVALEALQQSESLFRSLVEGVPQLIWRARAGGEWIWSSPQWTTLTALDEEESRGLGWLKAFHPEDREAALVAWHAAKESGFLELEGRICSRAERRYRHFRTRAVPVRDMAGHILEWLGTSTDVDDILQLQNEQAVLVGELQHRTRNLMAVVQAVTMRTLKGTSSLKEFQRCIDDRLQALARVQGLLSRRGNGLRVTIDALLRAELSAHVELDQRGRGEQVTLEGPKGIALRSATVQTLALAIHELATNAVKYGALAVAGGHMTVAWSLRTRPTGKSCVHVDWRETGVEGLGKADSPPNGGGYGRELIERALPYQLGARTSYGFEADGVHCTIEVDLPSDDEPVEASDV